MIDYADVIYGLAWGDEGKGKIANALAGKYDFVCRWNGGSQTRGILFTETASDTRLILFLLASLLTSNV